MNKETKAPNVADALHEIDTTRAALAKLREPFTGDQVSKLPKPYKKDSPKGNCAECGGYHGLPAMHLDYVGHAALTARLLDVDPEWTWEPMGRTPEGLPAIQGGGLWIKLTVCGVSRYGFGDAGTKQGPNAIKEMIGDALRNAAMRFGAALDLWHKGDLHAAAADDNGNEPAPELRPITDGQQFDITALAKQADVSIQTICEAANVSEIAELTEEKAASIIKKLNLTVAKKKPEPLPAGDIIDDDVPY